MGEENIEHMNFRQVIDNLKKYEYESAKDGEIRDATMYAVKRHLLEILAHINSKL